MADRDPVPFRRFVYIKTTPYLTHVDVEFLKADAAKQVSLVLTADKSEIEPGHTNVVEVTFQPRFHGAAINLPRTCTARSGFRLVEVQGAMIGNVVLNNIVRSCHQVRAGATARRIGEVGIRQIKFQKFEYGTPDEAVKSVDVRIFKNGASIFCQNLAVTRNSPVVVNGGEWEDIDRVKFWPRDAANQAIGSEVDWPVTPNMYFTLVVGQTSGGFSDVTEFIEVSPVGIEP